jgi:hypothetical protein
VRDRHFGQRLDHGQHHAEVVGQHARRLDRGERRYGNNAIGRPQQPSEFLRRPWLQQIDLAAAQRQRRDAFFSQPRHQRAADKSLGANDDNAARRPRGRIAMLEHSLASPPSVQL